MTEMTSAEQNPYQPPDDQVGSGFVEYPFRGELGAAELRPINPRAPILILLAIVLWIWGPRLVGELNTLFTNPPSLASGPGVLLDEVLGRFGAAGLLVSIVMFLAWRIWTAPRRMLERLPVAAGQVHGRLTSEYIEFISSAAVVRTAAEFLTVQEVKPTHLTVSMGSTRVIPAELFEDFAGARELALELRRKAKPLTPTDPRLTEPVHEDVRVTPPAGVIPFEGPIFADDLNDELLQRAIRRNRRNLYAGLILIAAGAALVCLLLPEAIILIGPAALFGIFVFLRNVMASRKHAAQSLGDDPAPTFYPCGWVSDSGVMSQTVAGWGNYKWATFSDQILIPDSQTLLLSIPGDPQTFLVLNRRQFASDADWDRVTAQAGQLIPARAAHT